jgi:parvulin-like peptidyl-prolyl isomerase
MIRNFFFILSLVIIFVNDSSFAMEVKIVAKIDNQIITNIDLDKRYKMTLFFSKINVKSQKQKKIILDKILQQMINEKLQLIDIKRNNIKIDPQILNKQIDQLIINDDLNLTKIKNKEFYNIYREQIKIKILFNKLIQEKISPNIQISNSAINEILEINNIKNDIESFKISEIYIAPGNNSLKIAQTLFSELQSGANFKKLSREFSDLYDYISNEDEYWIKEGELHPDLYQKISILKKGEFSNPIALNESYYIFKIIDQKKIPNINIDNLDEIKNIIFRRELSLAIKSYIFDLRKNSNIILF